VRESDIIQESEGTGDNDNKREWVTSSESREEDNSSYSAIQPVLGKKQVSHSSYRVPMEK
jgi:hypothetical protein